MKKRLIILLTFFCLSINVIAQNQNFLWAKRMGGISNEYGVSITADGTGNVYTTGHFQGTVDFDPGAGTHNLTSNGLDDIFISKLDVSGNFVWATSIGDAHNDAGNSIKVDASGNVYTTGYFNGTADFDPGPATYYLSTVGGAVNNIFVSKLDASGNFAWAKNMGGTGGAVGLSIAVDALSNVYTTGTFAGTADFDPGPNEHLLYDPYDYTRIDMFLSKLDELGNFVWAINITGGETTSSGVASSSIAVDASGSIYTTGTFGGFVDFDPGPNVNYLSAAQYANVFVLKIDPSGNFMWANNWGWGSYALVCKSLALDASGNIYTTGYFDGMPDFDPGAGNYYLSTFGNEDIFISKLDASGNFVWAKDIGNVFSNISYSIAVDASDNVYTTGSFQGTVDFDPGPGIHNLTSQPGGYNLFINKLDRLGNFVWAENTGGAGYGANGNSIAVDASNNVYATGYFSGTADFDPGNGTFNLTSAGRDDIFIAKFQPDQIIFTQPKIYTSKAVLNVGETQTITGKDFTIGGQVNLIIQNSIGDLIPVNSITYLLNGDFSFQLAITSLMPGGEYSIYATDVTTNKTSTTLKFLVTTTAQQTLWINKPLQNDSYPVNQSFQINWGDYVAKSQTTNNTGFVTKKYKIEISGNGGSSWTTIENEHLILNAIPGTNNNNFSTTYSIKTEGVYNIRITDNESLANTKISSSFAIVNNTTGGGFTYTFEWDESCPKPVGVQHPIGLAADGTSRIFIKLIRNAGNAKTVKNITTDILPSGGDNTSSGTALLGKGIFLPGITYNLDGNSAYKTSITEPISGTASNNNSYFLCLVAPDDFTQEPSKQESERKIKVNLLVTYTDNSSDPLLTTKDIFIVRPPLFLVHGINGDENTFQKAKYNVGDGVNFFDGDGKGGIKPNPVWKYVRRLSLYNYGSFALNAEVILGRIGVDIPGKKYYNSFQTSLEAMHNMGYASNRVDYVAHSMGGCVARTMINLYVDSYNPSLICKPCYKNYSMGFINKLITINTPNNGACIADLVNDKFKNGLDNSLIYSLRSVGLFKGFFVSNGTELGIPLYQVSPALKDLQLYHGGIRFTKTLVKNHLIGSDLDLNDSLSELTILSHFNNITYNSLYGILLPLRNVHNFMSDQYQNIEYLSNSDFMVPISSQLVDKSSSDITDISLNPFGQRTASIIYGQTKSHSSVTDDIEVGTRVMRLLNSPINSPYSYFADEIAANPNGNGDHNYRPLHNLSEFDSIKNYYDTLKIQIQIPDKNATLWVDSSLTLQLKVKDTVNLQQVRLIFQSQPYFSNSKLLYQTFNVKVNSDQIGKGKIFAEAIYDSSGYTINCIDTITVNVRPADSLRGFYVSPKSRTLNPKQIFQPRFNAIYSSYVGVLNNDIDSLGLAIADTNVLRLDSSTYQFVTKDTGSTHIIFSYKGFADTMFILLTSSVNTDIVICPGTPSKTFTTGADISGSTYQWQVDNGSGFSNITDNTNYTGTTSNTLNLANPPSSYYGYKYQCVISNNIGSSTTTPTTLKFGIKWTGAVDSTWENIENWSCSVLPDSNTDVIINIGVPNFPVLSSNASCRSLIFSQGAMIKVKTGYNLSITGKNEQY